MKKQCLLAILTLSSLNSWAEPDQKIIVDMAKVRQTPVIFTSAKGNVLVRVINMAPLKRERGDYSINVTKTKLDGRLRYSDMYLRRNLEKHKDFVVQNAQDLKHKKATAQPLDPGSAGDKYITLLRSEEAQCKNSLSSLESSLKELVSINDTPSKPAEQRVEELLEEMKVAVCQNTAAPLYDKLSQNEKDAVDAEHKESTQKIDAISKLLKEGVNAALESTTMEKMIEISNDHDITVEVMKSEANTNVTWAQFIYRGDGEDSRWLTHYGFTFLYNRGEKYYSEFHQAGDEEGSVPYYTVEAQNNKTDILYSPTILWTYPWRQDKSFDHGLTAGLGANENSLLVLIGYSLIFGKNVIITASVAAQEFPALNGNYKEHQRLDSSVDSSALEEKVFDGSVGVSVGFRF